MEIFYIKHGITPVEKFWDEVIYAAFLEKGIKVEVFDFAKQTLVFRQLLQSSFKDTPLNQLIKIAREYASALIPQKIYSSKSNFIFFMNGHHLNRVVLKIIKDLGRKMVMWQIDDPYWTDLSVEMAPICEFIFTVDSAAVPIYQENGCKNVFFLPLAFPSKFENFQKEKSYESDICFVGTPFKNSYRVKVIDELSDFLKNYKVKLLGSHVLSDSWQGALSNYETLKSFIKEEFVPYEESVKYQLASKINLNIHRDSFSHNMDRNNNKIMAKSPNDRTFILGGLGAFQLVDDLRPDLGDLFEIGKEIVTFSGPQDLKEKIAFYMEHDKERQTISSAAQKKVLSRHTCGHRIDKIIEALSK